MGSEQIHRIIRGIFLVSAGGVAAGFLMLVPALLGWDASAGMPSVIVTVGSVIMGVGAVTGGVTGLMLMTS